VAALTSFLDSYFERIGWNGGTSPTLETLGGLISHHLRSIPFEHLDVLLGRPIRLDLENLEDKLLQRRRGGYCFEHTSLFFAVLENLGFQPVRHSARVVLFSPRTESPRAHMFLTVTLPEGTFIADPGFGGGAPAFPVPLAHGSLQLDKGATHWMVHEGGYWTLRSALDGKTADAWVSTLEHDHPVDFEMANHFTATHPNSPFRNRLMMSIFTMSGRVSLMNQNFTIREEGASSSGTLADRAAFRAFVAKHFGFDFIEVDRLHLPFIPEWN